jgi:hypothetical protein
MLVSYHQETGLLTRVGTSGGILLTQVGTLGWDC